MMQQQDPRQYFCRRRLRSVGPFSRRELLALLVAGQIDASTLIRKTGESVLRPLAMSEAAELIPATGQVWSRWATPWRLWRTVLGWPLLAGMMLRLHAVGHFPPVWGPHLALLAASGGLIWWLYRLWRMALGDARPQRALIHALPLSIPLVGWFWVWVGYFGLGRYLKVSARCRKLAAISLQPLFLAAIFLYYLAVVGIFGRWVLPGFQNLPAIYEVVFLTMAWYVVTMISLIAADLLVMRLLRARVEKMIGSLLGIACPADYSTLFRAEALLRVRLRKSTQMIALLIFAAAVIPQIRLDYCEIAQIYTCDFLNALPSPPTVSSEVYRIAAVRAYAAEAEFERAQREHDVKGGAEALLQLAGAMRFSLEEYQSPVPLFVLQYGRSLLRDGVGLLELPDVTETDLRLLLRRVRYEEHMVRRTALDAVHRYARAILTVLPAERPFAVSAAMETAMILPEYVWSDWHEILPQLELPTTAEARSGAALRQPHSRLAALRFFLRVNSVLLNLRMLQSAIAIRLYERECGRMPDDLRELVPTWLAQWPRNPLTGELLQYRRDRPSGAAGPFRFRLSAGTWPGVDKMPYREYLAPEMTVTIPPPNP